MIVWDFIYNLIPDLGSLFREVLGLFLPGWAVYLIVGVVDIILILLVVVPMLMVLIYMERRIVGLFQVRLGPNRAGWQGVLQPIADAIKVLTKESVIPAKSDKWVHLLAPVVVFFPALMVFAVIPFADGAILTDLNIGILYVFAITTLGIIGVFMAGWASGNKYSLLGAMRAAAQMVSYEIPAVLSILGIVMVTGSLSMVSIVEAQRVPFLLLQPLGFIIYFIAATAELNRAPLDLMEAESEIVAGYHTEYSGMKFSLFYLGEYTAAFAVSAIVSTLFLSGWKGWLLPPYFWFFGKTLAVFVLFLWMRSTLPRLRVDQLMGFAWKFLLPLALFNILITGIEVSLWPDFPWLLMVVNIPAAVILVFLWSRLFRLGRVRA